MLGNRRLGQEGRCSGDVGRQTGGQTSRGMLELGAQGRMVGTKVHARSQTLELRSCRCLGLPKRRICSGLALLGSALGAGE